MSLLASDRAVHECEIVDRRVTEASPKGDSWNDWPSELDVIHVEELDCNEPVNAWHYAYLLGTAMGGSGKMRQVAKDRIPVEVRRTLARHRPHGRLYYIESVHFILGTASGQVDDPETRNILALFDPQKGYDIKGKRTTFETPALIVTLGCEHLYDGQHPYGPNRGYYKARCTKCGHTYEVDSGD